MFQWMTFSFRQSANSFKCSAQVHIISYFILLLVLVYLYHYDEKSDFWWVKFSFFSHQIENKIKTKCWCRNEQIKVGHSDINWVIWTNTQHDDKNTRKSINRYFFRKHHSFQFGEKKIWKEVASSIIVSYTHRMHGPIFQMPKKDWLLIIFSSWFDISVISVNFCPTLSL